MSYSEIIKRLQDATGPDREIDAFIATVVGEAPDESWSLLAHASGIHNMDAGRWMKGSVLRTPKAYTASIDTAIAFVERMMPGWEWATGFDGANYGAAVSYTGDFDFEAHAKTAPIAILLSIFQALDAKVGAA